MGGWIRGWLNWLWDESDSDSDTESSERSGACHSVRPDPPAEKRTLLDLLGPQQQVVKKFCKSALDDKDIAVLDTFTEMTQGETRARQRGVPVAVTEAKHPATGASVHRSMQLMQMLLSTQALTRTTEALQAAAARLQAAAAGGTSEGDGQYQHVCGIIRACLHMLMLAGCVLQRTAVAAFAGELAARTPVPGGRGATVADGAAALLYQLTAPELAAALAGVLDATRCCQAATEADAQEAARRGRSRMKSLHQLMAVWAKLTKNTCEAVYEILACSYLTATFNIQQYKLGGGGDSLLGAASAFPPAAAGPAAGAAAAPGAPPGLPNLLAAHRRLLSSLTASSLVDVMAGAVLALPALPEWAVPHAIRCAATSTAHLATIGRSLADFAEQHLPGAPAAAEAEALAHECAALLSAPVAWQLQRALLERWLIIQVPAMAEAAVAEATQAEAKVKAEGSARKCAKVLSLQQQAVQQRYAAYRAAAAVSCGEPLLDRVLVLREVVQGPIVREAYYLGLDMLVQTEPLLCTLLLLRSTTCLSGAGAASGAAAAPVPSLARAPECAALLARVMETACGVERAGGRLGYQPCSLRVVKMAGAVLRAMWCHPHLTPARELLDAAPAATEALWWGLAALVPELQPPGDLNELSARAQVEVESISVTLLEALEALVDDEATGLRALDAGARAALSSRLSACGWPRTTRALLRLHAARRPEDAGEDAMVLTVKLLNFFLRLDPATASAAAPITAAAAADLKALLSALSALESSAAEVVRLPALTAAQQAPNGPQTLVDWRGWSYLLACSWRP